YDIFFGSTSSLLANGRVLNHTKSPAGQMSGKAVGPSEGKASDGLPSYSLCVGVEKTRVNQERLDSKVKRVQNTTFVIQDGTKSHE
ncbi:hypothetical protein L9F63_008443, partial [Diploptera punctata]